MFSWRKHLKENQSRRADSRESADSGGSGHTAAKTAINWAIETSTRSGCWCFEGCFLSCKTQNTEHYWWTVVTRTSSGWPAFHLTNLECWLNNWERLLMIISAGELCAHGRRWSPERWLENKWLVWGTKGASAHTAPLLTGDLQWASQRGPIFSKWAVKHRGVLPLWNMVAVTRWAMREVLTVVRWVDGASQEGWSKRIIWGGNVFVSNN